MNFAPDFHGLATTVSQRLLFSAVGGTLLAAVVWLLLQLFPKRDPRTNFAVWFSTLLATALLPMLSFIPDSNVVVESRDSHALLVVSSSWAWYIFLAWAIIALAGLVRVVVATFQVRRLRRSSTLLDTQSLSEDLRCLIEEAQKSRPVAVLVSQRLEVPTAIGFRKAAIILPAWLLENTPAEELEYILLHELAHLRRRDDWTNLTQKVLKALLFFLPSVWWIERRLALDREMACDDAVLAHSGSPRGYAECLARVAERSFLRRQLALAQAAVGRVRQLTQRVTMILDPERPRATQLWKPAIPVVMILAGLCALPASLTPELIGFADNVSTQAQSAEVSRERTIQTAPTDAGKTITDGLKVHAVPASLRANAARIAPVKAKAVLSSRSKADHSRKTIAPQRNQPTTMIAKNQLPLQEQYVTVREEVFFVVTQRTASGEQQSWQVHMYQVSVQPQARIAQKPQKI